MTERDNFRETLNFEDKEDFINVVGNLENLQGEKIGFDLAERIAEGKRRLLLIGEPSGGKTTIIAQLAYVLHKWSAPAEAFVFYDEILRRVETDIKKRKPNIRSRDDWQISDWNFLDENIYKDIKNIEGKRALIEVPGIGKKYGIRSRGKNAVKTLAKEDNEMIFVFNIADPATQLWGAMVREEILNTRDDMVFEVLHDKFRADIQGIEHSEAYGKRLKDSIRWAAAREHIDAIDIEMMQTAKNWFNSHPGDVDMDQITIKARAESVYQEIVRDMNPNIRDKQVHISVSEATRKIRLKAAFAQHYLKDELGLDEDRGFVTFNPFMDGAHISVDSSLLLPR